MTFAFARRAFCLLVIALVSAPAAAQRSVPIGGDRLSGFVLPVEAQDGDIQLRALKAYAWTVDDTKRLVLEGDVHVRVGPYRFESGHAVVWINRVPSADGLINQIAAYFDELATPRSRSGLGAGGQRLLLTASARGEVDLEVARLDRRAAPRNAALTRAERRLASYLQTLAAAPPPLRDIPAIIGPTPSPTFRPRPGGTVTDADVALPAEVELPSVAGGPPWLKDARAVVRFGAGRVEIVPGEEENTIRITDRAVIDYTALGGGDDLTQLTLSAQRAVIFTDPGPLEEFVRGQLEASAVRGIYLEGNVTASTNEGEYTVRAPRAYYDFRRGQAILLDAVLRTYSREVDGPVYARAAEMRQLAEQQWEARKVRATTSEFAVGHLALGAERMTVTQRPGDDADGDETHIDSVDNTLRVEGVPVLWWPRFTGQVSDVPLRNVSIGYNDTEGATFETTWDLFSLLGREPPRGIDSEVYIDGYTRRGAGVGGRLDYDVAVGRGAIDLYGMYDDGEDLTSSGGTVEPEDSFRGLATWENMTQLGESIFFDGQLSYISDPTFVTSWREEDFAERREYETSAYLKWQSGIFAIDGLAKDSLNDFISNDYLLASRAYSVDRLPDFSGRFYGMSFADGAVTYSQETRFSRMMFAFDENTAAQLGVRPGAFGLPAGVAVGDAFAAAGYPDDWVLRIDTRHEVAAPMTVGIFDVVPYATGRFTWYDNDFETFAAEPVDSRVFLTGGIDLSTRFQRVNNEVESDLLDLHRLRHIIEPTLSFWYGYSNVETSDLPVYDQTVEPLTDGYAVRVALRNIWQTQRGGPGRWRSVDVLTVDAAVVIDEDGQTQSPTPQYFDYRPEFRQFGDHVYASAVWLPSDSLSIVGEMTYDIENSVFARGSIGGELQHTPQLSTFVEYRFIDASDNKLLGIGWDYRLSRKYRIRFRPQWDFEANDFRAIDLTLVRSFPSVDILFRIRRDEIREETTFSAAMELVEF